MKYDFSLQLHVSFNPQNKPVDCFRASDISWKKKQNFAGFSREKSQNSWKNRPISREKSQNSQKNRPISREKSQNSQKNRPISRDFSGKKSNFEGFSGANC